MGRQRVAALQRLSYVFGEGVRTRGVSYVHVAFGSCDEKSTCFMYFAPKETKARMSESCVGPFFFKGVQLARWSEAPNQ